MNKLEEKTKEDYFDTNGKGYGKYENHRLVGDAIVYKSGFHPIRWIKNFLYDLYHPSNYSKSGW